MRYFYKGKCDICKEVVRKSDKAKLKYIKGHCIFCLNYIDLKRIPFKLFTFRKGARK